MSQIVCSLNRSPIWACDNIKKYEKLNLTEENNYADVLNWIVCTHPCLVCPPPSELVTGVFIHDSPICSQTSSHPLVNQDTHPVLALPQPFEALERELWQSSSRGTADNSHHSTKPLGNSGPGNWSEKALDQLYLNSNIRLFLVHFKFSNLPQRAFMLGQI